MPNSTSQSSPTVGARTVPDPRSEPVTQVIEESVFVRLREFERDVLAEPTRKLAERAAFWGAYGWTSEPVQVVVVEDPMAWTATITLRQRLTMRADG